MSKIQYFPLLLFSGMVQVFLLKPSQEIQPEGDDQHGKFQPKQLNIGNIISNWKTLIMEIVAQPPYRWQYKTTSISSCYQHKKLKKKKSRGNVQILQKAFFQIKPLQCLKVLLPPKALESRMNRCRTHSPRTFLQLLACTHCFRITPQYDSHDGVRVSLS